MNLASISVDDELCFSIKRMLSKNPYMKPASISVKEAVFSSI